MSHDNTRQATIGAAGHVDHGKTTLIKALTDTDTDRLKEEKERGMTIDLGFAPLDLPGGQRVGIVDVPGHERFLKNMLAGVTGVDIALLVIAADEGVMPQTREHLDILQLLETRRGVVALTKCDMVDPDWLDLVEEEIRAELSDTFLKNTKIMRVSAITGLGISDLGAELSQLAAEVEEKPDTGPFRLPVDRVFTIQGFGTVVTGTLVSGTIHVGDAVEILPNKLSARVRNIEVHDRKSQNAQAGTRVAINLAGALTSDIKRGDVLVPPEYLRPSRRVDAYIRLLSSTPQPIKSRTRIRLHIGAAEHLGRLTVIGNSKIAPGGEGYIQFISESDVVAARKDRFVIRSYSPMHTIGGGTILGSNAPKRKSADPEALRQLESLKRGDPKHILEDALLLAPGPVGIKDIATKAGLSEAESSELVEQLASEEIVRTLEGGRIIHSAVLASLTSRIVAELTSYHQTNSLKTGMPREDLKAASAKAIDSKAFAALISEMMRQNLATATENLVKLPDFSVTPNESQARAISLLTSLYETAGYNPPAAQDALLQVGENGKDAMQYLIDKKVIVKIDEGIYLSAATIEQAEKMLREKLADGGRITVSEFRDLTGSSRRFALPLLQYFDDKRITRREGDERVLVAK